MDLLHIRFLLFLSIILLNSPITCHTWGFFSTSSSSSSQSRKSKPEFSMEVFNNQKAIQALEDAQNKLVGPNSCWKNAYSYLLSGCKEMVATEEKRKRFAWQLSDCFLKDSGRPAFPTCKDEESTMMSCLKKLDDHEHKIYLEFLLETNTICQQLQSYAFKNDIERLVNDLKRSAQDTEDKLDILESKSDVLVQSSSMIHESLGSVDVRVRNVAKVTNTIESHMSGLSHIAKEIYQEQKGIAETQFALRQGQEKMGEALRNGMKMFNDAYTQIEEGVETLKANTNEIEGEISLLGNSISSKMNDLQSKTDDIGAMAGTSLDKQKELLDGQSVALDGLQFLTRFQTEAIEESRSTLKRLAEFSQDQQQDLAKRQEQLQQVHAQLFENSKSMLDAQVAFEAKQANMFVALDKLFALHNAMLLESRVIKAFFIYLLFIFVIYMFTSTKQTYTIRPRLYIGLCVTLALEVASLRFVNVAEHRAWIIIIVRSLFGVLASAQLLHAALTFRDYEALNHNILLGLVDKVNNMRSQREEVSCDDEDTESELDWSSWIDTEIIDDGNNLGDFDYETPKEIKDNSIDICSSGTRRLYNLRQRKPTNSLN